MNDSVHLNLANQTSHTINLKIIDISKTIITWSTVDDDSVERH